MMMNRTIKVAEEFYDAPAGRFPEDGDYNGERFREAFLVPALREANSILIDLDDSEGYGSSFLEASFGGLVRLCGYTPAELHSRISIKSDDDESFIQEIWEYIDSAKPQSGVRA